MKLIIDVPEETFNCLKNMVEAECVDPYSLADIIVNRSKPVDLWKMRQEATENALKKAEVLYKRPQGEYVDISKLRLMTVEECAGHTIDYAMGWKACIEWIKKGGAE